MDIQRCGRGVQAILRFVVALSLLCATGRCVAPADDLAVRSAFPHVVQVIDIT